MNQFLEFFILIPLIGYIITLIFIPRNKEINLFGTSVITVGINLLLFLVLSFFWAKSGFLDLYSKGITIYKADDYEFAINLFFDNISATYYLISSLLTFLVLVFSRYYIHREKGFKSFFCNVLFFYLGLSFIIFSGNFETMFIGWEIIGMSSFFLIGFYRDRYLPVKNALKVVSVYRIADIFYCLEFGYVTIISNII
jgi:NADH-quinone oxidoreductase subunit L